MNWPCCCSGADFLNTILLLPLFETNKHKTNESEGRRIYPQAGITGIAFPHHHLIIIIIIKKAQVFIFICLWSDKQMALHLEEKPAIFLLKINVSSRTAVNVTGREVL